MKNLEYSKVTAGTALALSIVWGVIAGGCGGGEEAEVTAAPAPRQYTPPADPTPTVISVADLMAQLSIDARIILPENQAPSTTEERKAVLVFFDAFARGDNESLHPMLTGLDQRELNSMVDTGVWDEATKDITSIEIQTGSNEFGQKCALSVIEVDFEYQPQLWYYMVGGDNPEFESAPCPPGILDELSGDWIEAWHRILGEEIALGDQPDEEFDPINRDLDPRNDDEPSAGGGGGGTTPGGTRPSPGGGGKKPPRKPRKPPGPG